MQIELEKKEIHALLQSMDKIIYAARKSGIRLEDGVKGYINLMHKIDEQFKAQGGYE